MQVKDKGEHKRKLHFTDFIKLIIDFLKEQPLFSWLYKAYYTFVSVMFSNIYVATV